MPTHPATRLALFTAALAAVFGGALAVGAVAGPIDTGDAHPDPATPAEPATRPRGLAIAEAGYRLALESSLVEPGVATELGFTIVDTAGEPVTQFDELHERPLHLIVLSRNLVDYLHLHPQMRADGRWTVALPELAAGSYRVFADFQPAGAEDLTLAADLAVPGDMASPVVPAPAATTMVDGYEVTLTGAPTVGESQLSFTVQQAGAAVRTDPYLGAAGHLVAIRSGDLAYLHVHPHEEASTAIPFTAEFPSPGTYRLFLDFSHAGEVRTAAFTVAVPDGAAEATPAHEQGH
jgi:hypothetical protein